MEILFLYGMSLTALFLLIFLYLNQIKKLKRISE